MALGFQASRFCITCAMRIPVRKVVIVIIHINPMDEIKEQTNIN